MDVTENLELAFKESFLHAAPLYKAAKKFKLPIEDIKREVTLYRGSLHEEARRVELIADYKSAEKDFSEDWALETVADLGLEAGVLVDGLIRIENARNRDGRDPRNSSNLVVTDIFNHEDGRSNVTINMVRNVPSVADPEAWIGGWVSYRFYFACAAIRQEYQATE